MPRFLSLPWELIDLITEFLTESDRVALSGTCRLLRKQYWKPMQRLSLNVYCRSIEGIKWIQEHPEQWSRWRERVSEWAESSLEVLKFARTQGCGWGRGIEAARAGRLDVLEWFKANDKKYKSYAELIQYTAAKAGHLEILKWGLVLRTGTYTAAAGGGHLEILEWLKENGCPCDEAACAAAARDGHLEALKWLRENGCSWDSSTCSAAAKGGYLEILQWARDNGCDWSMLTCSNAAEGGHLEVLKWLREHGCPWMGMYMCTAAAKSGNLEVLKWVRSQGCSWDEWTWIAAEGSLDIMKWLVEQGCPCPKHWVCRTAARGGHLDVLEWAWTWSPGQDTDGLIWDAAGSGSLKSIIWLLNHGCKWTDAACENAAKNEHTHILKWIRDNGYCLGGKASYDQLFKDGQYTPYSSRNK